MITSVSDDLAIRKGLPEYEVVYNKLHKFIEDVNEKIVGRIQLVQQVYLEDYKQQVSKMAAQLRQIRSVLDEQLLRQRSNQRLFYLEEERDFFRAQVIKLNEDLKKMKNDNETLKVELYDSKNETENYKKIAYELETKIYKLTHENLQMDKLKSISLSEKKKKDNITESLPSPYEKYGEKDFQRTMHTTLRLKPSQSMKTYSKMKETWVEPSNREQILDRCIKQVKKEIYYRTLTSKETEKIHFDESNKISFEQFTKTDRKQVIQKMMSQPDIMQNFYEFVFQRKYNGEKPQKPSMMKVTDPKFNTMSLLKSKTQFNKKIFNIRANRY